MSRRSLVRMCLLIALIIAITVLMWDNSNISNKTPDDNNDFITTNNRQNKRLDFYYYIPQKLLGSSDKEIPALICIPGLNGEGDQFRNSPFQTFAEKEGFVLICPSFHFDKLDWFMQASYQYPNAWSGEALLNIIKKVEDKHNIHIGKCYLYGISAGAQFALRFAIWNPDKTAATVGHASGGLIEPNEIIPVKYFISVGEDDTDRIETAEENCSRLEKVGIDVSYKMYEGGHWVTEPQLKDSFTFIKNVRDNTEQ
ncbi:MAG: hypothetical protein H6Q71_2668 [Firmicutes bacterium]|nr:hypothetical protein [Bacillota bacterium]